MPRISPSTHRSKLHQAARLPLLTWFMVVAISGCADWHESSSKQTDIKRSAAKNLLIIVADDLGHNDLAITNGNPDIHTPNLNTFARQSMRFHRHYASLVCSPARAALLTGMAPERLGFLPNGRGIPSELETLPELLSRNGFNTWHIGKWHLGDEHREAWPDRQGFAHWLGFLNQWRLSGTKVDGEIVLRKPRYINPYLQGSEEPGKHFDGHLEEILTDKALSALTTLAESDRPWFLHLAYYAPHAPMQPDIVYSKHYPDTDEGRYKALVHQLDHNVGRVLSHLEALDVMKETIVVFVSDNGGTTTHYKDSNLPFYGRKSTLTEGGLRAPLIIRWPESALQGRVIESAVSIVDLYPTLTASLGLSAPVHLDGVDHFTALASGQEPPRRALFWDDGYTTRSFGALSEDGRWRLYQPLPFYGAMVDRNLFDLQNDESASRHVDAPEVERALYSKYLDWFTDVHTVATRFGETHGQFTLTGSDVLRTPGFGGFTFGAALGTPSEALIAEQADIWRIQREGATVTVNIGEVTVAGTLAETTQCQTVVLAGKFDRRSAAFGPKPSYHVAFYINGQIQQEASAPGVLQVTNIGQPTHIGRDIALTMPDGPIIWNTTLSGTTPITVGAFSEQLCEQRNTAQAVQP